MIDMDKIFTLIPHQSMWAKFLTATASQGQAFSRNAQGIFRRLLWKIFAGLKEMKLQYVSLSLLVNR